MSIPDLPLLLSPAISALLLDSVTGDLWLRGAWRRGGCVALVVFAALALGGGRLLRNAMPGSHSLVVHATHEAGLKLGGIGAVLDGLLSATSYVDNVERTILVGPMLAGDPVVWERLTSPRSGITLRYSSLHGIFAGVPEWQRTALQQVEQTFAVALLYGTRRFGDHEHEIILVDVSNPNWDEINLFKYYVWQNYGFDAARYSWDPEFNLYFMIAGPIFAALKAIGADAGLGPEQKVIVAHEWLGMPVVFAAQMTEPGQWRSVFYAHETATARRLIEDHDGHDTRFYNVLYKAKEWGMSLETAFGNQDHLYKNPLLKLAARCDNIFAVGDLVMEELRFLGGPLSNANIDLVYNGITPAGITLEQKLVSKGRLQSYCESLLGYVPDYVFTHVTRMVPSKALWRDIRVLEHLDGMLRQADKRAVLFVLSTSVPAGRRPEWVAAWEEQYGWPAGHRGDNGDLIDLEAPYFFNDVEPFNRSATQSRIVLVNQFGWNRERCGQRMPSRNMEFPDIRFGSDLEFGQSIAKRSALRRWSVDQRRAVPSTAMCGCAAGFVASAASGLENAPNLVIADYVSLPGYWLGNPYDALAIDGAAGSALEQLHDRRPSSERLPKGKPRCNTGESGHRPTHELGHCGATCSCPASLHTIRILELMDLTLPAPDPVRRSGQDDQERLLAATAVIVGCRRDRHSRLPTCLCVRAWAACASSTAISSN